MPIPTHFSLANRSYVVVGMDDATFRGSEAHGLFNAQLAEISVYLNEEPEEWVEHTYYHELTHALLEAAGRADLSKDEQFVDLFGAMLHQYMSTQSGDLINE